jgi:transposase
MGLTHKERKKRRRDIARDVKSGVSIEDVSRKYDVATATIYESCREHGTQPPKKVRRDMGPNTYLIIAALLRGQRQVAIATEHNVSPQRVNQVADRCREAGITLPPRKAKG